MKQSIVVAILLCIPLQLAASSDQGWKVERVSVSPQTDGLTRFTAMVSHLKSSSHITVKGDVPFMRMAQYFVAGDKLAVLGNASNTDAVAIFDLNTGNEIDWFYCYAPQRVWENWIVFVEWYPNHTPEMTSDVVLVYDLARSPRANRIEANAAHILPPLKTGRPTRVGFPIFPESNVIHRTYKNVLNNQSQVQLILGGPGFVATPRKKLIFVVSQEPGGDARSISNRLVIVNLSKGLSAPTDTFMSIPEAQLKKRPRKPGFVRILRLELEAPTKLRILVPEDEYGVQSIKVSVPDP